MSEAFELFFEELDFSGLESPEPLEDEEYLERRDQYQRATALLNSGEVTALANCPLFQRRNWEIGGSRTLRDLQLIHPVDGYGTEGAFYRLNEESFFTLLVQGISQGRVRWDVETASITAKILTDYKALSLDDLGEDWRNGGIVEFSQTAIRQHLLEANYLYAQLQPIEV